MFNIHRVGQEVCHAGRLKMAPLSPLNSADIFKIHEIRLGRPEDLYCGYIEEADLAKDPAVCVLKRTSPRGGGDQETSICSRKDVLPKSYGEMFQFVFRQIPPQLLRSAANYLEKHKNVSVSIGMSHDRPTAYMSGYGELPRDFPHMFQSFFVQLPPDTLRMSAMFIERYRPNGNCCQGAKLAFSVAEPRG